MLLIIGSSALNFYRKDRKTPRDFDAIADYDTASAFLKAEQCSQIHPINDGKTLFGRNEQMIYEIEIAWPGSTGEILLDIVKNGDPRQYKHATRVYPGKDYTSRVAYADLNMLYALKMSHRYLRNSPHFLKTRNDILEMRQMGAVIPDSLKEWYGLREDATYWYQHPNLNRTKQEFFTDPYLYDHDSLHEAVKVSTVQPAYKYFADPEHPVKSSKKLWEKSTKAIKRWAVVEEASVLALERSLIPHPGVWSEDKAFTFALQKVCTSITSGWFREYAWENYDLILHMYTLRRSREGGSLLELLKSGLDKGIVKYANQES